VSLKYNNPLNIVYDGTNWLGLVGSDGRFCEFADMIHGLRAGMINLRNYQVKHGINTIRGAITRHAPPIENPTDDYIKYVANRTHFDPDDELDFTLKAFNIPVIHAQVEFENGVSNVHITPRVYQEAASLAALS
jgi:hypothetical protein